MEPFPACVTCPHHFSIKGPIPHLLPCLHSVCETCVTSAAGGVISCSSCLKHFDLSKTTLKQDIIRQREVFQLTVKHRPTELLCTNADDGNQAVSWCPECEELFCEHCLNMHDNVKGTRHHKVVNIGSNDSVQLQEKAQICPVHKTFTLDKYDVDCKKLICLRCQVDEHEGHTLQNITDVNDDIKQSIKTSLTKLSEVKDRVQQSLNNVFTKLEETDQVNTNLQATIGLTFTTLKTMIDQREKEVLIELDKATERNRDAMSSQRSTFQTVDMKISSTISYLEKVLLHASSSDLMTLKTSIEEIVQTCLDPAKEIQEEEVEPVIFNDRGVQRLKLQIPVLGGISTTADHRFKGEHLQQRVTWHS